MVCFDGASYTWKYTWVLYRKFSLCIFLVHGAMLRNDIFIQVYLVF